MKKFEKDLDNGDSIVATVRFDDRCGNGHNTLSVTGEYFIDEYLSECGCLHGRIVKAFPFLKDAIRFHLVSTDGPLHYLSNGMHHAKNKNYDYFRSSAIWHDIADQQIETVTENDLIDRLPAIMEEFQEIVETLGFTYTTVPIKL